MSDRHMVIAESIKHHPHHYALDIMVQSMFRHMDLSQLLIYFIDTVNPKVLPILAQEFNLIGNKGWNFAIGDVAQRDLLSRAVQLHRYKGTPWAIEQALELVGITSGTVIEGVIAETDLANWARFKVEIDTSIMVPTALQLANATVLIEEFKNARSEFRGFLYV